LQAWLPTKPAPPVTRMVFMALHGLGQKKWGPIAMACREFQRRWAWGQRIRRPSTKRSMAYRDKQGFLYLRAGNFGGDGVLGRTRGALGLASKGRPVRHARDFTAELLACRRRHDDQVLPGVGVFGLAGFRFCRTVADGDRTARGERKARPLGPKIIFSPYRRR
jgi:hypothetical protein